MTSKDEIENFKDSIDFLREEERIPGSTGELRISSLKLLNWIRGTNKEVNEHKEVLDAYKEQFDKQTKKIEKQEEKLKGMITQQIFTNKAVKMLNSLIVGAIIGIVLLIAGIVCDLVRDNSLYGEISEIEKQIMRCKIEELQKEIIN